jgi:hypothetical protein
VKFKISFSSQYITSDLQKCPFPAASTAAEADKHIFPENLHQQVGHFIALCDILAIAG